METQIILEEHYHRGKYIILVRFKYERILIDRCKSLGMEWSYRLKGWFLENTPSHYEKVKFLFRDKKLDESALRQSYNARLTQRIRDRLHREKLSDELSPEAATSLVTFEKYMRARNYSGNTIANYLATLRVYFSYFAERPPLELGSDDYILFCNDYLIPGNYSKDYQRMLACALRLYYKVENRQDWEIAEVIYPRKTRTLPVVLSRQEVHSIILSTPNLKAECILSLMYSCGLRVGEVLRLRWKDVDRERSLLWVRQSKGFKDRSVPLSAKMMSLLERYYHRYHSNEFVFEGQFGGQYSSSSINQTIRSICL
ncbi:MAG: site-specific integrase, partial [Bacteroidota bacterium]|nr:site-specific integrase [Bacteroidota bacterium]MDX5430750.1 site-specific integrase [Bacteroidota bacterium]MDX5469495.1 site-specific integrase [Bacteroidota bacterium]